MRKTRCDVCGRTVENKKDAASWAELKIDVQCKDASNSWVDGWNYKFYFDLCESCKKEYIEIPTATLASLFIHYDEFQWEYR